MRGGEEKASFWQLTAWHSATPCPHPSFSRIFQEGPWWGVSPLGTPGTSTSLGPFLHRKSLKIVFYNDEGSKLNIALAIFIYFLPLIFKDIRSVSVDPLASVLGFPGGSVVQGSSCNAGAMKDAGPMPGWGGPLEEGTATHSSILAWRLPWTEEPGGLQSTGSQRDRRG